MQTGKMKNTKFCKVLDMFQILIVQTSFELANYDIFES